MLDLAYLVNKLSTIAEITQMSGKLSEVLLVFTAFFKVMSCLECMHALTTRRTQHTQRPALLTGCHCPGWQTAAMRQRRRTLGWGEQGTRACKADGVSVDIDPAVQRQHLLLEPAPHLPGRMPAPETASGGPRPCASAMGNAESRLHAIAGVTQMNTSLAPSGNACCRERCDQQRHQKRCGEQLGQEVDTCARAC